jgi:hypothetical protein
MRRALQSATLRRWFSWRARWNGDLLLLNVIIWWW